MKTPGRIATAMQKLMGILIKQTNKQDALHADDMAAIDWMFSFFSQVNKDSFL